jgi:hypothetical protein
MIQVVVCLTHKCKALGSELGITKKKKKKRIETGLGMRWCMPIIPPT